MSSLEPMLGSPDVRTYWLWALGIVGLHFIPMAIAFGPIVLALGVACMANAAVGLAASSMPFLLIGTADGLLKVLLGGWMLLSREPGRSAVHSLREGPGGK